jgi:hypothetical protein
MDQQTLKSFFSAARAEDEFVKEAKLVVVRMKVRHKSLIN